MIADPWIGSGDSSNKYIPVKQSTLNLTYNMTVTDVVLPCNRFDDIPRIRVRKA